MRGTAGSPGKLPLVLLLLLPVFVTAALAIGVQIQPGSIVDGNPISVTLSNVTDGYTLSTTLVSTFPATSHTNWLNITNWRYDFDLQKGNITVIGENVNRIRLVVRVGSTLRTAEDTGAGNIIVGIPMDILTGVYYDYRILYQVHNASAPVTITLIQQGIKMGTDDSVSTPSIYGVGGGNIALEVRANGILEGGQGISVALPGTMTANTTPQITPGSQPPTQQPSVSTTVPGTTLPATPSPPVQTTPPVSPSPPPPPGPQSLSPFIIGYAGLIILITILADYFIMRD